MHAKEVRKPKVEKYRREAKSIRHDICKRVIVETRVEMERGTASPFLSPFLREEEISFLSS